MNLIPHLVLHYMMKKRFHILSFFKTIMWYLYRCKKYKEKFKQSTCENTNLKKPNETLEENIKTLEESMNRASTFGTIDKTYVVEKLKDEIACLTKDFGKFLESSNNLTIFLKYHQHIDDKSGLGLAKNASSSSQS